LTEILSGKLEECDQLIERARKSLESRQFEDAESNTNIASSRVKQEIEKIQKKVEKIDTSSEKSMGNIAAKLQELDSRQKTIILLQETIKKEKDRAKNYRLLVEEIGKADIVGQISTARKMIEQALSRSRTLKPQDRYFLFLRRWNSFTPLLSETGEVKQGGGYFFVWDGTGIVIDPGIGFLQNLLSFGYSICDIDSIVLTHSHVDHTADLEAILTVLHELNSARIADHVDPHLISVYANIGVANKFMQLMSLSFDNISKLVVLSPSTQYDITSQISINTHPGFHKDLYASKASCLGLAFTCSSEDKKVRFGITSDTGFSSDLSKAFSEMKDSMLILHIGSVLEEELDLGMQSDRIYEQHLGLKGTYNMIYEIRPKVAIISEIGEEMKDTILPIVEKLQKIFPSISTLPSDIGLKIDFSSFGVPFKVECQRCKGLSDASTVAFGYSPEKKSIEFLCSNCKA